MKKYLLFTIVDSPVVRIRYNEKLYESLKLNIKAYKWLISGTVMINLNLVSSIQVKPGDSPNKPGEICEECSEDTYILV